MQQCTRFAGCDNAFLEVEKEGDFEAFNKMLTSLRKLQLYILLKRNTLGRTRDVFEQLAEDEKVKAMVLEDPHYKSRVRKTEEGIVEGLDKNLVRDVYCSTLKTVKAFVKKSDIQAADLEGMLGGYIYEKLETL